MNRSPRKGANQRQPQFSKHLTVLYEDDAVIAVNKPAGLASVPVRGSEAPSALSLLVASLKPRRQRAYVVHRIDRYTSGILLFAKTERDRDALVREFLAHRPVRQYLAVVRGQPTPREATLVHYFRKDGMFQKQTTASDSQGARAELRYTVERTMGAVSMLRVTLITGLQNQIRVQLSAIGHPVVGDRKYHPEEAEERRIARVALHATHLHFLHPRTRAPITIDCEIPPDFQALLRRR